MVDLLPLSLLYHAAGVVGGCRTSARLRRRAHVWLPRAGLMGLLPVCGIGIFGAVAIGGLATTDVFGLTAQVLHAAIGALAALTTVGAIQGMLRTVAQLPGRLGIVAALRGRSSAVFRLPAPRE